MMWVRTGGLVTHTWTVTEVVGPEFWGPANPRKPMACCILCLFQISICVKIVPVHWRFLHLLSSFIFYPFLVKISRSG